MFLFLRDVCDGDLVTWIDTRLAAADRPASEQRVTLMRAALLEPLSGVFGISFKVLAMALADLLLAGDSARERWVMTGASMIAIDTLVHNWLYRSGCLQACDAVHLYGPGCYGPSGCAAVIEGAGAHIDARAYCPEGPRIFPRMVQKAIWRFCTEGAEDVCNGNRIDDRERCQQVACPMFADCGRVALRPPRPA